MNGIFGNKAVFVLLVAFLLAVSLGGALSVEMMGGGAAYNCPYMGVPVLCAMSPLQHLSEWQQTFATIVQQIATEVLLLLVLCAALFLSIRPRLLPQRIAGSRFYRPPPSTSQGKKITGWLSLFENSPSAV